METEEVSSNRKPVTENKSMSKRQSMMDGGGPQSLSFLNKTEP